MNAISSVKLSSWLAELYTCVSARRRRVKMLRSLSNPTLIHLPLFPTKAARGTDKAEEEREREEARSYLLRTLSPD